jgi:hypothetical protein
VKLSKDLRRRCEALAGGTPPKARAKPRPAKLAAGWAVELTLPTVVVSEMNRRDFWAVRRKRFKTQADTLRAVLYEAGLQRWLRPGAVAVTLTHVGRRMDSDNLAGAFKGLRDALADYMLADDGDDAQATWAYRQEAGTPGVKVRVEGRADG